MWGTLRLPWGLLCPGVGGDQRVQVLTVDTRGIREQAHDGQVAAFDEFVDRGAAETQIPGRGGDCEEFHTDYFRSTSVRPFSQLQVACAMIRKRTLVTTETAML